MAILTIALPVITGVCSLIYKLLTMFVFTTDSDEEAKAMAVAEMNRSENNLLKTYKKTY